VNYVQFVITVYNRGCSVVYITQHEESSTNFAEVALYWIWNNEDCSRFSVFHYSA